jgi:Asp-tRNA(Asn)/Glu-tRNA(Gln) amidotransferase A subunit family amidase
MSEGLPVGLQIVGKHFDERTLLGVAHAYEAARGPFATPPNA